MIALSTVALLLAVAPRAPVFSGPPPPAAPTRVVSLSPAITETLFAVGRGDVVVGVTRYCDRPAAARALPKVGGNDVSLEAVLALRPDLVIAQPSAGQHDVVRRLGERGVAVVVVFNDSVAENARATAEIGALVGRAEEGAALGGRIAQALAAPAPPRADAPRVIVVVGLDPLVVAGPATPAAAAVLAAGAALAVEPQDPAWPQWSIEVLLARRVDIALVADGAAHAARVAAAFEPLGDRAPRVVAATHAVLMRPGPALIEDAAVVRALLGPPAAGGR